MKIEPKTHKNRYDRWVKYFQGSVLTDEQIKERADQLTKAGRDPGL